MFVIVIGILFILMNINDIYGNTFGGANQGIVLLEYTIQGNEYTFMKRSVKRSIYIQVMLFSMNGIYTLFKDRKQELMIFATGNIYRETGTASKDIEVALREREKMSVKKMRDDQYYIINLLDIISPPRLHASRNAVYRLFGP